MTDKSAIVARPAAMDVLVSYAYAGDTSAIPPTFKHSVWITRSLGDLKVIAGGPALHHLFAMPKPLTAPVKPGLWHPLA